MMDRLAFADSRRKDCVDALKLLTGERDSLAGFREGVQIILMGSGGLVESLFQGAFWKRRTAVADIRRGKKEPAVFLLKVRTMLIAEPAAPAEGSGAGT